MSNIISKIWFGGRDTIGVVIIENDNKVLKAYIGKGHGFDEDFDAQNISDWGSTFPIHIARMLALFINGKNLGDTKQEVDLTLVQTVTDINVISDWVNQDISNEELGRNIRSYTETMKSLGNTRSFLVG